MVSSEAARDTQDEDTLIKQLEKLCTSNLLSIKTLRDKTSNISPTKIDAIANSDYILHAVCRNDNISKSIVEHMLRLCPMAVSKPIRNDEMYPLHLAAANPHCPGSVIKLLVKRDSSILEKRVSDYLSIQSGRVNNKFPLHYYILRRSNYDYGIIKFLVKSYPAALTRESSHPHLDESLTPFGLLCQEGREVSLDLVKLLAGTNNECLELKLDELDSQPLFSLLKNSHIKPFPLDAVQYFIEHCTAESLSEEHIFNGNVLHAACSNKNVTVEAIQLLLGIGSDDLVQCANKHGTKELPIHVLCQNKELDETTSLAILNVLVDLYPESVQICCKDAFLPIHHACINKSFEFCRYLIEKYPECISITTQEYQSPFHLACSNGSLQLVKYLYELRPSSIHVQTYDENYDYDDDGEYMDELNDYSNLQRGRYALHLAVSNQNTDRKDIIRFILEKDSRAASRVGSWGRLPLHQACTSTINLDIVTDIFEAYPEAIHTKDMFGRIPIHYACGCHEYRQDWRGEGARYTLAPSSREELGLVIDFLYEQLPYSLHATDAKGRVCAHFACGSTQALTKIDAIERNDQRCPDSFMAFSEEHYGLPIHFACKEKAPFAVINRLVIILGEALVRDVHYTYPLHIVAVVCGKLDTPQVRSITLGKNKALLNDLFNYYPAAVEQVDNLGWLPLHHAVRHDAPLEIIQLLVERYPEGVQVTDIQGSTLLHIACRHGSSGSVVNYLTRQLSPEATLAVDSNGFTSLHVACKHGVPLDIFNYLICINSHLLTMQDNRGELPLHKACRGGHLHLIKEIIDLQPASVSVRNNRNELPIFILCKRSGKDDEVRESVEYTETIWKLLLAHPETVSV